MPILIVGLLGALFLIFNKKGDAIPSTNDAPMPETTAVEVVQGPIMTKQRLFNLPDIDPSEQGGSYKQDYDVFFESVADATDVPFALLKAHALMESSLKPDAFRNENPSNRADRQGWASRGLMQILWWPGSNRWKKYGYPDSVLMNDGSGMFDPHTNIDIAAHLIAENINKCEGNIRDAINMYNTGKKESVYKAPYSYVDRVMAFYSKLIKKDV